MVGPWLYQNDFGSQRRHANDPWVGDLGIVANGDFNNHSALEIAMFHMNKRFLRHDGSQYVEELTQVIHITMGYKHWLTQDISYSAAVYSEYPMGMVRVVYSDFPSSDSLQTSAHDTTKYGMELSVQGEVWQGPKYDIITDLRYAYSLTNRSKEFGNHYGAFIALRWLVQEKNPDKKPNKKDFD
jgi:hypothetical protein